MRWNFLLPGGASSRISNSLVQCWTSGGSCLIDVNSLPPWQLLLIVPVIAFLYASVGFGGASGYLAVISMSVKNDDHELVPQVACISGATS
jgi:hypothetical protein